MMAAKERFPLHSITFSWDLFFISINKGKRKEERNKNQACDGGFILIPTVYPMKASDYRLFFLFPTNGSLG